MKTFIYSNTYKSSKWGGPNVTMKIYRVKNNKPILLGTHTYSTASMRGHDSECIMWLYTNKHCPKSFTDGSRTCYINYENRGKTFQIYSI